MLVHARVRITWIVPVDSAAGEEPTQDLAAGRHCATPTTSLTKLSARFEGKCSDVLGTEEMNGADKL